MKLSTDPTPDRTEEIYQWALKTWGSRNKYATEHALQYATDLGLSPEATVPEILAAALQAARMGYLAANANYGFYDHINNNMPIETVALPAGQETKEARAKINEERQAIREQVARQLIGDGMEKLGKSAQLSSFWIEQLWKRFTLNRSREALEEDGLAVLDAVLSTNDTPDQFEAALAKALANRFPKAVVKAELAGKLRKADPGDELITEGRNSELDSLREILKLFVVAAEGEGKKLFADTFPISFSWGEVLLDEVNKGNRELLTDLETLRATCAPALHTVEDPDHVDYGFKYDVSWEAYTKMAAILAKHFPELVLNGLETSTLIVATNSQEGVTSDDIRSPFYEFICSE